VAEVHPVERADRQDGSVFVRFRSLEVADDFHAVPSPAGGPEAITTAAFSAAPLRS